MMLSVFERVSFSRMPIDDPYPRWYHPERSGNGATFFEKFIGEKVLTD
jgi:hypothetical protein